MIEEGGGSRTFTYHTNINVKDLMLLATDGLEEWVKLDPIYQSRSRTDYEGETMMLYVGLNSTPYPREGALFMAMQDDKGNYLGLIRCGYIRNRISVPSRRTSLRMGR